MFKTKPLGILKAGLIALPVLFASSAAHSLTAVIEFKDRIDEAIIPKVEDRQTRKALRKVAKQQKYRGQIVIQNFEEYASFDRATRSWAFVNDTFDVSTAPNIGMSLVTENLGGFEGGRVFVANPDFNYDLPACSSRQFRRGDCDILNPQVVRLDQPRVNYGELIGQAELTVVEGIPTEFQWSVGRDVLADFDTHLQDNIPGMGMNEINVNLSKFEFVKQKGEFLFFKAKSRLSSVELIQVDVEAPAQEQ